MLFSSIESKWREVEAELSQGKRGRFLLRAELKAELLLALTQKSYPDWSQVFGLLAHCQTPDADLAWALEKLEIVDFKDSTLLKIFYLEALRAHQLKLTQSSGQQHFTKSLPLALSFLREKDLELKTQSLLFLEDWGLTALRPNKLEILNSRPNIFVSLLSKKQRDYRKLAKALASR